MVVEGKCIVCDSIKDKCITNKLGLVCFECISDGRFDEYESKFSTIFIKDENGKEYRFENPEFECELLKIVTESASGCEGIIGYVVSDLDEVVPLSWNLDGRASHLPSYNLALIKPKWYEDESNFINGVIMVSENATGCLVAYNYEQYMEEVSRGYRVVTKEELLSLYYQGKEC